MCYIYIYDTLTCSYIKFFEDSMASDKRTDSCNAKLMLLICLINSFTWLCINICSCKTMQANSIWLYIVPEGMRSLMNYIKQKYANPPVIITENGKCWDPNTRDLNEKKKKKKVVQFHDHFITYLIFPFSKILKLVRKQADIFLFSLVLKAWMTRIALSFPSRML